MPADRKTPRRRAPESGPVAQGRGGARRDAAKRRVLIVGATGLVGASLLPMLLASERITAVHALARRLPDVTDPRLHARIADFDTIASWADFPDVDDVHCCLGTTIKVAGSREAFRKVDFDYVVGVATAARGHGARRLSVVSAMGADSRSSVFYNRVKGEMEEAVTALGFESVTILRPSLLSGDRPVSRPGERFALALAAPFAALIPKKYRPVAAHAVARAMLQFALDAAPGMQIVESDEIQHFAGR